MNVHHTYGYRQRPLRSLAFQQDFERRDELQVGSWGHVVVALQFSQKACGQIDGGSVEALAHFYAASPSIIGHLDVLQEPRCNSL